MAQAINYDAIAPSSSSAAVGAKAVSSNFLLGGQKLNSKKGSKAPTPKASTPIAGQSTNTPKTITRRTNGPQPLRLAPNKLFFGYEIKPVKTDADREKENQGQLQPHFAGQGQTLSGRVKKEKDEKKEEKKPAEKKPEVGRRLDGRKVT
jgi:ubiquitin fusion degradation protein 1